MGGWIGVGGRSSRGEGVEGAYWGIVCIFYPSDRSVDMALDILSKYEEIISPISHKHKALEK